MRQIVLDTETTGLDPDKGHRVIEIGCVELVNRRPTGNRYHQYIHPERPIDPGAIEVHGLTDEFLAGKPHFRDIADEFLDFVRDAELIIHNAAFDVGFLNRELSLLDGDKGPLSRYCPVFCTLILGRQLHPGQKNSLDALCKRYGVDNSQRTLHGALLDAEILVDVYLAMTGGQASLSLDSGAADLAQAQQTSRALHAGRARLSVPSPTPEESAAHQERLAAIDKASGGRCVWKQLQSN